MKKILFIFITSFFFNLVWENLHSLLYTSYKGGEITESILIRATLADAIMIVFFCLPFIIFDRLKKFDFLIIIFGLFVAVYIEIFALSVGRWQYNAFMPVIPFLNVGLTPTIQLGLLGFLTKKISDKKFK